MAVVVQITPYHDRSRRRRRSTILYLVSSRLDVHAGHCLNAHASRPLTSSSKSASFTATPIWLTPSFSILSTTSHPQSPSNNIAATAAFPQLFTRYHGTAFTSSPSPAHSSPFTPFGTPSGNRTVLRPPAVPLQIDRLGAETRAR
ncbi:hypothetical protein R3P38DRAFT_3201968 [Favolaschia claudopus]|uniref:Uncharacterized protein n=1 Tax=Favolaschia claudopus TaxID=2862362 RepID=A0AAW0AZ40_9AGAR